MSVQIKGGVTGTLAYVDVNHNLQVNTPTDPQQAGYGVVLLESDPGAVIGTKTTRPLDGSPDYRARVGIDTPLFPDNFIGGAVNTANWYREAGGGMTASVSGGYATLNNGGVLTSGAYMILRTYRSMPLQGSFPTYFEWTERVTAHVTGAQVDQGAFICIGAATPTEGVYLRRTAGGQYQAITAKNGVESPVSLTAFDPTVDHHFLVSALPYGYELWMDDVLIAATDTGADSPLNVTSLPVCFRVINTTAVASAMSPMIGSVFCSIGDMNMGKPWSDILASAGAGGYQGQTAVNFEQTTGWVNSTVPGTAVLSNTAASYTTLGGKFLIASVLTAETDFVLFGFTVPALATGVQAKNLYIRGVYIDTMNLGVGVATTPTVFEWAIAVGSTNVSLATVEGIGTKSPRRVPLGIQSWVVGALAGAAANSINRQFAIPLVAEPGTFVQVILRIPVSTATASRTNRGSVSIDAYWE